VPFGQGGGLVTRLFLFEAPEKTRVRILGIDLQDGRNGVLGVGRNDTIRRAHQCLDASASDFDVVGT